MKSIRAACCLLALMLLSVACSGSENATTNTEPASFDAVLIELFGTNDTEAYLASAEQAAAELVASCMNDAGFEFQVPVVRDELEPPDPASIEDAREQGFGLISGFRFGISQTEVAVELSGDPNLAYLSTLTQTEVDRFVLTLDGPAAEPGQRKVERGCNGTASDDAYAGWVRFSETLPNYTALGEERDTHPDWLSARSEWRDCMVERGFDYAEPDVIRTDVTTRMRQTIAEVYPEGQLPLVQVDGVFALDPEVDGLLDELADFEIAAAVANVECTEPLASRFEAVERLVQEQFVERNRDAIDELLEQNT